MEKQDGATPTATPVASRAFADSRALRGASRHCAGPAVELRALGALSQDGSAHGRWIALVLDAARVLGWPDPMPRVLTVGEGPAASTHLAFAAPAHQLTTAQALNEWAWEAAPDLDAPHPLRPDPMAHFKALAATQDKPALLALLAAAERRALPAFSSDGKLTLGEGAGSVSYAQAELPAPDQVPWDSLHSLPKMLVTGSHGKTTVLRLLAAMAREAGLSPGLALDGDGERCREVLRDPAVQAALMEVSRSQLLGQGLPVRQAQVAVVTNVSLHEPGEQTQHGLDDRAETMLTVAHALAQGSYLLMNGDDAAVLRVALRLAHSTAPSWGLFSRSHDTPLLGALRRHGGSTCAPRGDRLVLSHAGQEHDLGELSAMPLTLGGSAQQNINNVAAAALAAAAAGWPMDAVRHALLRFGAAAADNPGRLERWMHCGFTVVIDSASDSDALASLLKLAGALGGRRVGLLLGPPGSFSNESIAVFARTAASFKPDRVVIKDLPDDLCGREPGEVPLLLEQVLRAEGLPARALRHEHDEEAAVHALLGWAKPGDVVLLPLHAVGLRESIAAFLQAAEQAPPA